MTDMTVVNISAIQAVALASVTYYFGVWVRRRVNILERFSIPTPVVGGMLVAFVLSALEGFGICAFKFDTSLQTLLMLAVFPQQAIRPSAEFPCVVIIARLNFNVNRRFVIYCTNFFPSY